MLSSNLQGRQTRLSQEGEGAPGHITTAVEGARDWTGERQRLRATLRQEN